VSPRRPGPRVRTPFQELVRLDGLAVRRRRHDRGWSPRELTSAIARASFESSGLRRTLSPNQLEAIEERGEAIPYDELLLLADGLDCDPVDLIADGDAPARSARVERERAF
jgi:DNA-binding Xre family transcriptional regulator